MAAAALILKRSDRFPVGQVVQLFAGGVGNRVFGSRPGGSPVAEATVDATGTLTFPNIELGIYDAFAIVAGSDVHVICNNLGWKPLGTLKERIAAARTLAGC